jgi:hypothetical protein
MLSIFHGMLYSNLCNNTTNLRIQHHYIMPQTALVFALKSCNVAPMVHIPQSDNKGLNIQ